ncbi:30S ribosomal protein S6 [Miniphocaeibacter halophilus]|uniref:30S ribosomal protein S6 n=1 Tax=Miniphocaeibacter halophilus TaxID=2931922 RepID=A0AC61MRD4_9FIRM|nr:30S ribosomal protein S6 [Miniphocaeibacter halophilus]QQK08012.1 30S ribosomal protein S6 [Miniphocaeibacter halophilus]
MRKYEGVLVFKPDLEDEARNQAFDRIKETIESNGKISEISDWGKRKLAYEIDYIKEGYYYIVDFEANPELITEIERRSRISDAIIRYMFVRKDA